ncbi:hypothetical protein TomMM35A_18510 [Sphingobium sp. TomMM35A]
MASVSKREWNHKGEAKSAWVVRYKEGGKHRQRTFERKKEADAYCRKVETEIESGRHIAWSETLTVAELSNEFMKYQEDRIRDGRIGRGARVFLDNAIRVHIVPRVGHYRVTELTPHHIAEMYRDMTRKGKLSPQTARSRIAVMKRAFDFGMRRRLVRENPVIEALQELRGIQPAKIRTFSIEDVKALLEAAETKKWRGQERAHLFLRCSVHLAAFCGLRFGEIGGLTVENVDLEQCMIRVRHNLTRYDELKGPKTKAGNRDVPMPSHVAALIAQWMKRYYIPNNRSLIFRSRNGAIINTNSFHYAYWGPLLVSAGLDTKGERLHFHALRHFAGSWMVENGWSLPEVAGALGHAKFDTTLQVYVHSIRPAGAAVDRMQQMADRLISSPSPLALPSSVAQGLRMAS